MPPFVTVNEAAKLTGKSPSSIRRVLYPIIKDDNHADREQIAPTVDAAKELRMKGENFAWRISEELLRRLIPIEAERPVQPRASRASNDANAELLAMLRRELDIKNQQITQQSEMLAKQIELISGLSERLREGNILIGSLQRQLALPSGIHREQSHVVETKTSESMVAEKGSEASRKKTKPRKSLFARLFL